MACNHHQWLDPYKTGSVSPREHPSSVLRQQRARELLEEYYGKIDLDICKKITRDHEKGFNPNKKTSGDICRHPDTYSLKATVFAYIVDPKKLTVHLTHGYPCKKQYIKHDFTNILNGLTDYLSSFKSITIFHVSRNSKKNLKNKYFIAPFGNTKGETKT